MLGHTIQIWPSVRVAISRIIHIGVYLSVIYKCYKRAVFVYFIIEDLKVTAFYPNNNFEIAANKLCDCFKTLHLIAPEEGNHYEQNQLFNPVHIELNSHEALTSLFLYGMKILKLLRMRIWYLILGPLRNAIQSLPTNSRSATKEAMHSFPKSLMKRLTKPIRSAVLERLKTSRATMSGSKLNAAMKRCVRLIEEAERAGGKGIGQLF